MWCLRVVARVGDLPVLAGGLAIALAGMAWLSQIGDHTSFFPGIGVPLLLMGLGMGAAFTPLTMAGIAGVAPADAGAASGLVNVFHQIGGAIGIAVLTTVFVSAGGDVAASPGQLSDAIATALTGAVVCLALALAVVLAVMWRPLTSTPALNETAPAR